MNIILTDGDVIVAIEPEDGIQGGDIGVNGKTYHIINIQKVDDNEIPSDWAPEKYVFTDNGIELNPNYAGEDIATRLNDIEQILIDLLDSI